MLREGNKAVAFQLGRLLSPGILVVRPGLRGRGYGQMLVEFCIREAQTNDVCFLHIQCTPETSVPFWEKMGFTLLPTQASPGSSGWHGYTYPHAYMILPKVFDFPAACSEVSVLIQFSAQCAPDAQRVLEHRPRAYRRSDGKIALENRVIGFHPAAPIDLVVKITVEGDTIYFDRAKYAERYGVQNRQPVFCLDVITPEPATNLWATCHSG